MVEILQQIPRRQVYIFKIKVVEFKVFPYLFDDRRVDVARVCAPGAHLERAYRQNAGTGADVGGGDSRTDIFFQQFKDYLRALVVSGAKGAAWIDIESQTVLGLRSLVPRREHDEASPHWKRRECLLRRDVPRLILDLSPVLDLHAGKFHHRLYELRPPDGDLLVAPVIHTQPRISVRKLLQLRADAL